MTTSEGDVVEHGRRFIFFVSHQFIFFPVYCFYCKSKWGINLDMKIGYSCSLAVYLQESLGLF